MKNKLKIHIAKCLAYLKKLIVQTKEFVRGEWLVDSEKPDLYSNKLVKKKNNPIHAINRVTAASV